MWSSPSKKNFSRGSPISEKKSRPTSVSPAGSPSCKSCPSWSETGFSEALCVTPANGATQEYQDLPFRSAGLKTLDWVGFISCLGQIECR